MRLELTGRHLAITPATRALVEAAARSHAPAAERQRGLGAGRAHARARADSCGGHAARAARALPARQRPPGPNVESAINAAADKIDRQAQKLKGKCDGRKRRGPSAVKAGTSATPEAATGTAIDSATATPHHSRQAYAVKPMSVEDAAARNRRRSGCVDRVSQFSHRHRHGPVSQRPTAISD